VRVDVFAQPYELLRATRTYVGTGNVLKLRSTTKNTSVQSEALWVYKCTRQFETEMRVQTETGAQ